jgi:hypothetical protein
MPEAGGDPPIIITGGSVTLDFNDTQLQGSGGHHHHPTKQIKRIEVSGGGLNINETIKDANGLKIKVYYGD